MYIKLLIGQVAPMHKEIIEFHKIMIVQGCWHPIESPDFLIVQLKLTCDNKGEMSTNQEKNRRAHHKQTIVGEKQERVKDALIDMTVIMTINCLSLQPEGFCAARIQISFDGVVPDFSWNGMHCIPTLGTVGCFTISPGLQSSLHGR